MATGFWVHNFPGSKDEHPTYINWPVAEYDILIATFFHEVFTALDAIQDTLGYDVRGGFADVNARITDLEARVTALEGA